MRSPQPERPSQGREVDPPIIAPRLRQKPERKTRHNKPADQQEKKRFHRIAYSQAATNAASVIRTIQTSNLLMVFPSLHRGSTKCHAQCPGALENDPRTGHKVLPGKSEPRNTRTQAVHRPRPKPLQNVASHYSNSVSLHTPVLPSTTTAQRCVKLQPLRIAHRTELTTRRPAQNFSKPPQRQHRTTHYLKPKVKLALAIANMLYSHCCLFQLRATHYCPSLREPMMLLLMPA